MASAINQDGGGSFERLIPKGAGRSVPTADVAPGGQDPRPEVPAVAFEHVSLAFDDNVVLRDLSFSVRAGHMTILIGASGAAIIGFAALKWSRLSHDQAAAEAAGAPVDDPVLQSKLDDELRDLD